MKPESIPYWEEINENMGENHPVNLFQIDGHLRHIMDEAWFREFSDRNVIQEEINIILRK
jgi:hypothetical protein